MTAQSEAATAAMNTASPSTISKRASSSAHHSSNIAEFPREDFTQYSSDPRDDFVLFEKAPNFPNHVHESSSLHSSATTSPFRLTMLGRHIGIDPFNSIHFVFVFVLYFGKYLFVKININVLLFHTLSDLISLIWPLVVVISTPRLYHDTRKIFAGTREGLKPTFAEIWT